MVIQLLMDEEVGNFWALKSEISWQDDNNRRTISVIHMMRKEYES